MSLRSVLRILQNAINGFVRHDVMTLGAGLAFYTALSLAPILVILTWATRFIGGDSLQNLVLQVTMKAGPEIGDAVRIVLGYAAKQHTAGTISGIIGLIGVLFSAIAAFSHLHNSLNVIWEVRGTSRSALRGWLHSQLLSLITMNGIGIVLLFSIALNTTFNLLPHSGGLLLRAAEFLQSLIVYILVFGLIIKVLPGTKIHWQDAFFGAIFTSGLFLLGNYAIVKYIRHASIGSIYGAAGSLFVFLVYIYYASIVMFFGAEVTRAYSMRKG
jgi:membrane protein